MPLACGIFAASGLSQAMFLARGECFKLSFVSWVGFTAMINRTVSALSSRCIQRINIFCNELYIKI
ncbi:hypothetical protein ATN83_0598 [Raoultella ornithinolytica]|nr:hypothetical protein ATN83_0598 [Raoultella ornithinolytica]KDV91481.1 hypothetical protein AB00_4256 [Raoultella ornithinolytica 2-156-04_S1_C1]